MKLVDRRNGNELMEAYQCRECGYVTDRPGKAVSGDDYISVCGECRSVECFKQVFANDQDEVTEDEFIEERE